MDFKPIDSSQEAAILAQASKPKAKNKSADFSIRTVTHWIHLRHRMGFCSVPSHYDNVPDTDYKGEKYDKYPTRMVITIPPYEVCRWCYIAEADKVAALENLAPTCP